MDKYAFIRSGLDQWYEKNARELPWVGDKNPYHVWLSEIILQQTQVAVGLKYYDRFLKNFPSITDFAQADIDDILALWSGLGYYNRARNMHLAAQSICDIHGGVFPNTYKDLIALKGIGDYTAAAIASFAYDLPVPIVDGNVQRIMARLFGVREVISSAKGTAAIREHAANCLDILDPARHNQTLLDFGSLICKPQSPSCDLCPLSAQCDAYKYQETTLLPIKKSKKPRRVRVFHYYDVTNGDDVLANKRTSDDIWPELYELPMLEKKKNEKATIKEIEVLLGMDIQGDHIQFVKKGIQKLSHQEIHAYFYKITVADLETISDDIEPMNIFELQNRGLPKIVRNYLELKN